MKQNNSIIASTISRNASTTINNAKTVRSRRRTSELNRRNAFMRWLLFGLGAMLFLTTTLQAKDKEVKQRNPVLIHVPFSELEAVGLQDEAVFMSQAEFKELWDLANKSQNEQQKFVCRTVEYKSELQDKVLKVQGKYTLKKVSEKWQRFSLNTKSMAIESATINGQTALLGNSKTGPVVFVKEAGDAELIVNYAVPVRQAGSELIMSFALPSVSSGTMYFEVPPEKRLLANGQILKRSATESDSSVYKFPVGNISDWSFRIADLNKDAEQDRLFFTTTMFNVFSKAAEIGWQAMTEMEVYGEALDVVTLSVPNHLEVTSVSSTGLASWELSDTNQNPLRTQLKLNYRQGVIGKRTVTITGVASADADGRWLFPNLIVDNADSQWGQIVLGYAAPWKVRVEQIEGVRRKTLLAGQKTEPSRFGRALIFDVWQPDFELRLLNESTKGSYQAAIATVLSVTEQQVKLNSHLTVEATGTELFDYEFFLPANWEIDSITSEGQKLAWKSLMAQPGLQKIQVPLSKVLKDGDEANFQINAELVDWILEGNTSVSLPELTLPQAEMVEGTLVVNAAERFIIEHVDSKDLEPTILGLPGERLSYRFHEGEYSGEIRVKSKPAAVVVQTTSLARLEQKRFYTQHEVLLDVSNAPIHDLVLTLNHLSDTNINFQLRNSKIRVTAELLGEDESEEVPSASNQAHTWRLNFSQPLQGEVFLVFDTFSAKEDSQTTYAVPEIRFDNVDRQYGFLLVEAEGEQRISTQAVDSAKNQLPESEFSTIPLVHLKPKYRLIEAFNYVRKGYSWELTEERFTKSELTVAFCDHATLNSILTPTGELQHQVDYEFRAANSQSLLLQFVDDEIELWSVMLNGEPEPVRKSEQGFQVKLSTKVAPGAKQTLRILYSKPTTGFAATSRLEETPPVLSVVDGGGEVHELIMVSQEWNLRYPKDSTILKSEGDFHPREAFSDGRTNKLQAVLETFQSDFWWKGLLLVVLFVGVNLSIMVYKLFTQHWKSLVALFVAGVSVCGFVLLLYSGSTSSDKFAGVTSQEGTSYMDTLYAVEELDAVPLHNPVPEENSDRFVKETIIGKAEKIKKEDLSDSLTNHSTGALLPKESSKKTKSRLSVRMALPNADGMQSKSFQYIGSQQGELNVVLRNRKHDQAVTLTVFAAVMLLFWTLNNKPFSIFGKAVTVGFIGPVVLLLLAPVVWAPWLIGALLGTLGAIALVALRLILRWCVTYCCPSLMGKVCATSLAVLLLCSNTASAQQQVRENASPITNNVAKPAPSINLLHNPDTFVVPYKTGTNPLQADQVLLKPDQFKKLWKAAYDAEPGSKSTTEKPVLASAAYVAKVGESDGDKALSFTARFVVHAFSDSAQQIRLPISEVTIRSVKIEGETAELETRLVNKIPQYWLRLSKTGMQVVDVDFQIPVKRQGDAGQFSVQLLPVPAGTLTLQLPDNDLQIHVAGTLSTFRKVKKESNLVIEQPISAGGNLEFKWQPQTAMQESTAIVHANTINDMQLNEAGVSLASRSQINVRRGQLNQLVYKIPEGMKVRNISGVDVGGWSLQEEGAEKSLQIMFRRTITGKTELNVELYLPFSLRDAEKLLPIGYFGLQNLSRVTGTIAVHASPHLSLKTNRTENLQQINPSALPAGHQYSTEQTIAFRFHKVPFELNLSVWRKKSSTTIRAEHALFVERQVVQYSSRFIVQLQGEPTLHAEYLLPENYLPIDVQASHLDDWYIERQTGQATRLILEFTKPQQGEYQVALSGKMLKEIDAQDLELYVPRPVNVDRIQSNVAIWFSEYYTPRLLERGDWKTYAVNRLPKPLLERSAEKPRFAFNATRDIDSAIRVQTLRTQSEMSANAVTLTNVSDTSLAYTIALKWTINHGGADQFVFTLPEWLHGKVELSGSGIRQAVESKTEAGRIRWVVETQKLQQSDYFLTAVSTFELPGDGQFTTPTVQFEKQSENAEQNQFEKHELSPNDSIIVNQSQAHLKQISGQTSTISATDIPIKIESQFLDQAVAIQRLQADSEAPAWSINWSQQFKSAPAQILLADISTVIEQDGSLRGEVVYTMRNRSKQHLALEVPESVQLLSILVGRKPTRAVEGKLNGADIKLIPLPKQSQYGLSYTIRVVFEVKQVTHRFMNSFQFQSRQIDVPVPLVVGLSQSEEWGVPVLHTQWTVYAPHNYEFDYLEGVGNTNLSQSDYADRARHLAILDEAKALVNALSTPSSGSNASYNYSRTQQQNLNELSDKLLNAQKGLHRNGKLNSQEEAARQEIDQKLGEVQRELKEELSRLSTDEQNQQTQSTPSNRARINRDVQQRDFLSGLNSNLIITNGSAGIQVNESGEEIKPNTFNLYALPQMQAESEEISKPELKRKAGTKNAPQRRKSSRGRSSKSTQSYSNALGLLKQQTEQNGPVKAIISNNSVSINDSGLGYRALTKDGEGNRLNEKQDIDGDGVEAFTRTVRPRVFFDNAEPFESQRTPSPEVSGFSGDAALLPPLENFGSNGTIVGLSTPGPFSSDGGNASEGGVVDFNIAGNSVLGGTQVFERKTFSRGLGAANLSLPVSISREGQKISFLKAGGRPKLILTAKSQQLWTSLLSWGLAIVALLLGWISWKYFFTSTATSQTVWTGLVYQLYLLGAVLTFCFSGEVMAIGLTLLILGAILHGSTKMLSHWKVAVN